MQTGHVSTKEFNNLPYIWLSHSPQNNPPFLLSQYLNNGNNPPRNYLAQKIFMFHAKTMANYKMFVHTDIWIAPRATNLMLLHSKSRIPASPKFFQYQKEKEFRF